MAERKVSVREARASFSEILGNVHFAGDTIVIEKKGRPFAALVSLEDLAWLRERREKAWAPIDRLREANAQYDEDEIDRDVTAEVEVVRQSRYGSR
jgi:prevent-host-death family protein